MNSMTNMRYRVAKLLMSAVAAALLGSIAAPATADLLEDAKTAASRLNNLGDLGRAAAEVSLTQARQVPRRPSCSRTDRCGRAPQGSRPLTCR